MYRTTAPLREIKDPRRRAEALAERAVVLKLIDTLLAAGAEISVDDGEERHPFTVSRAAVLDAICNTDMDWLRVRRGSSNGAIHLVYGNSGWDVICDYTTNLEELLAPVNDFAETLEPLVDEGRDIEVEEVGA